MKKRFWQLGTLAISTVFTLIVTTSCEQLIPNNDKQSSNSLRISARASQDNTASQIYQKASPATVTVQTGSGHGSGFVVSQDGFIITNAHVIKPSPTTQEELEAYNPNDFPNVVTVVFPNGKKASADVLGFGKDGLDLAILKIHSQDKLPTLPLASGGAKVGDRIFTLGTPLDTSFKDTFTQGNVTRIDPINGDVQHDAVIQGGNSGGPLLNTQGQVVGVNTAGITSREKLNSGMNFAIPVARVQSFINAAKAGDISPISTLVQRSSAPTIATIALNTPTVNASLAQGDRTLQDGSFGDYYQFSGRAGQKIVINMSSQEMNSFLLLYQVKESAQGQELEKIAENDDQGPGNFNSQIEATLPQDGTYLIIASSQERGESGNYTLQAITQP